MPGRARRRAAQEGLEAAPFVVVGEAVEDDRILAHVGVHVEEHRGTAAPGESAAVAGVTDTGTRPDRPPQSTSLEPLAPLASPGASRSVAPPLVMADPRRGRADARNGIVVRWRVARASASAAFGGLGGPAAPGRLATMRSTWSSVALP